VPPPPAPPPESLAPAVVIAYVLADLAIILIAARIVGGLFARLGQPRIVGEIIAGIVIGPTVLGGHLATSAITALDRPAANGSGLVNKLYPLQAFSFLSLLGSLALVLFMFLVGLEVQQRYLKGRGRQIAVVALAVVAVPGQEALAHMVVEPADVAVKVLGDAGVRLERVHEVLVVTLEDEPGALGRYCRRLADAGINLEAVYLAGEEDGSKQLVLSVSDLEAARGIRPGP
jgi:hypothetical protein